MERLCEDLVMLMDGYDEHFDEPAIRMHKNLIVGGRSASGPLKVQEAMVDKKYLDAMLKSEKELFERHPIWTR